MKIIKIIKEALSDILDNARYFVENNLVVFASILNMLVPYIMYFIGQDSVLSRGEFAIGGEIFIPLFFAVVIYILKSVANKIGKGVTIPLPGKRFTEVDDDGEVSIENKRVQELILYVADLEDWLERKGLL